MEGLEVAYAPGLGRAAVDDEVRAPTDAAARAFADMGAEVDDPGSVFEPLEEAMTPHWLAGFAAIPRAVPDDRRGLSVAVATVLHSLLVFRRVPAGHFVDSLDERGVDGTNPGQER